MEPEKKSNGALVGLIVIVIILVVGGIYIWRNKNAAEKTNGMAVPGAVTNQDSDEVNTLEKDLEAENADIDVNVDAVE